jgi:glutamine synthetase
LKQPATKGNGYEEFSYGRLPGTLQAATQAMKKSKLAKDLFGKEFVDHFTKTREWEVKEFRKNVKGSKPKDITHWELKRYFEII